MHEIYFLMESNEKGFAGDIFIQNAKAWKKPRAWPKEAQ